MRILDLRVGSGGLRNEMYASSSQRRIRRSVLKVPCFYVLRRVTWNGGKKNVMLHGLPFVFGENFPPLISYNSNHFLLLWHHHDGPLPLMLSPQRWLHARPLSLSLSTPPLWPVCTSALARDTRTHTDTHTHMGACDAARLGRAPVAWFSEAALTGLFVSAVELKIKPGKEFG